MTIVGTAMHTKIAEAVVLRIRELALSGISDANVQLRLLDEDLATCMPGPPGVMVVTAGIEQVNDREGENKTDLIGYPVGVILSGKCEGGTLETVTEIDRMLKWREDIRKGFWHKPDELIAVGGPSEIWEVSWSPGQIFLPQLWKKTNLWVGAMLLRVRTCEART